MKESWQQSAAYATGADSCRIFSENMKGLYLLALLLTADPVRAEQCFVARFLAMISFAFRCKDRCSTDINAIVAELEAKRDQLDQAIRALTGSRAAGRPGRRLSPKCNSL